MATVIRCVILSILLVHVGFAGGTWQRTCPVKKTVPQSGWQKFWNQEKVTKTSLFCCAGYLSVYSKQYQHIEVTSDAYCKPYCQPSCPANSSCEPPTSCKCLDSWQHLASPTTMRRCKCNEGFVPIESDQCVPACPDHCINGNCSDHKICTCNDGYKKNDLQMCVPQCPEGCEEDTECTEPGFCSLKACKDSGFERNEMGRCMPKCTNGCPNGNCTAPENCTCNEGYTMNKSTEMCEAKCDNCTDGACMAPQECLCNEGFEVEEGVCVFVDVDVVFSDEFSMDADVPYTVWLLVGVAMGLVAVATVAGVGFYVRKRTNALNKSSIEAPIELQQVPRPMLQIPEADEAEEEEIDNENDLYGKF